MNIGNGKFVIDSSIDNMLSNRFNINASGNKFNEFLKALKDNITVINSGSEIFKDNNVYKMRISPEIMEGIKNGAKLYNTNEDLLKLRRNLGLTDSNHLKIYSILADRDVGFLYWNKTLSKIETIILKKASRLKPRGSYYLIFLKGFINFLFEIVDSSFNVGVIYFKPYFCEDLLKINYNKYV